MAVKAWEDPDHADAIETPPETPRSTNPFADSASVTVSVPASVEVRLVDATVLLDYEVWSLVTSIFSSAVVGFLVAFLQSDQPAQEVFGIIALLFLLLCLISGYMAYRNRRTIQKETRSVEFSLGDPISGD